ncbi:MAG: hypothetical protein ACTHU0_38205, partial [Kofleriaceae bacterium]
TGEGKLVAIDWDSWFAKFDHENLALIYQERTAGGARSNFNKLVSRANLEPGTTRRARGHRPLSRARGRATRRARTTG